MKFLTFGYSKLAPYLLACLAIIVLSGSRTKKWELSKGRTTITINPACGGRISQVTFQGEPLLVPEGLNDDMYGSVWWPSPQINWTWPPPKVINEQSYHCKQMGNGFKLISEICDQTGIQLDKKIQQFDETHFRITYEALNATDSIIKFAHWEVSRFKKEGRIIFPVGDQFAPSIVAPKFQFIAYPLAKTPLNFLKDETQEYFDVVANTPDLFHNKKKKLCADGKGGWTAYLINDKVIIKSFEDIPVSRLAPHQGEVELYIAEDTEYMEIEQQSAYSEVNPNQKSVWTVDWLIYSYANAEEESTEKMVNFVESALRKYKLKN